MESHFYEKYLGFNTLCFDIYLLFYISFYTNLHRIVLQSLGCVLFSLMYLEGPFDQVWLKKDSVALAVQNKNLPFPANDM